MGMINPLGACDNSLPPNCDAPPTLLQQLTDLGIAVNERKFLAIVNQQTSDPAETPPSMEVVINTLGLAGTWAWISAGVYTFTFTNMTLPVAGTAARINNNKHNSGDAATVYATVLLTGTPRSGLTVTVGAGDEDEQTINAVLEVISTSMPTLIVP